MSVGNITNTFSRKMENDAKFGFYPTPLDVVSMEMALINMNGISANKKIPICDFTGGEGEQIHKMYEVLKEQEYEPIAYYNEITKERFDIAQGRYASMPNFHLCNADLFRLKCRNKSERKYDPRTMVIIRNNPPYGEGELFGSKVRLEETFFLENDRYLVSGGIHILEVPITTLINNPLFMAKITFRYEDIQIYKFPKELFPKFKQVVIVGKKKVENSQDVISTESWLKRLKEDNIQYLDEISSPIYCLTDEVIDKAKEVTVFRDGTVNKVTLSNGLYDVLDTLLVKEKESDKILNKAEAIDEVAIIERTVGHRTLELASGKFNKINGNVLVYGYADKKLVTDVVIEENEKIITETEVIVAGIEVTNKYGEILRKESD